MTPHRLRSATPDDVPAIVGMIKELAEFEHLSHLVTVTPQALRPHLFGENPAAAVVVAEIGGESAAAAARRPPSDNGEPPRGESPPREIVGFALYFTNFSTFLAKPGLYLEDLYVKPAHRGAGIGKSLLQHLGQLAVARGYGRFEWSVLDWNANAIRFYEGMGATLLPDWRICRISGDALAAFERVASPAGSA